MTKPTRAEVLACNNDRQLNDWAAVYCMGWRRCAGAWFSAKENGAITNLSPKAEIEGYNPSQDKEQAFDLMVKYKLGVARLRASNLWIIDYPSKGPLNFFRIKEATLLPKYLVKAAIIAALFEDGGTL